MGDRGNIVVHGQFKEERPIYLYTHWGGYCIKNTLQRALGRRQRWDDSPYLTRIIFCEMVGKENFEDETGFGISTSICDNEYNLLHVYPEKQMVQEKTATGKTVKKWTFEEFIREDFKESD